MNRATQITVAIDAPGFLCSKFRGPGVISSRASRDTGQGMIPAHANYNAKSACRLKPQAAFRGANSTLDRNSSRRKSRGGPTGRPLILVPARELRTSGKGLRVPSDEGKGRRYVR